MTGRAAFGGVLKFLSVLMVSAGIGLAGGLAEAGTQLLVVRHDMGGSVKERLEKLRRLAAAEVPVRISGTCVSACTLYLGLPRTCVEPEARLGFHGPSTRLRGIPLTRGEFERLSQEMARHYPPAIRAWFLAEARMVTGDYITITGAEAIRLGARACG